MTSQLRRQCAFLLAMFYLTFAGGIEFLHHHTDGVFPGFGVGSSSASKHDAAHPGIGKTPLSKSKSPSSECAACQWAQNGHATTPQVQPVIIASPSVSSFACFSSSFTPALLDTSSTRGPPLS
jgi:hypothetical protein